VSPFKIPVSVADVKVQESAAASGLAEPKSTVPVNRQKLLLRKKSSDVLRINVEQLEIDRTERPFGFLPLLCTSSAYFADTVDLTQDEEARKYWLTCFEGIEFIINHKMQSDA